MSRRVAARRQRLQHPRVAAGAALVDRRDDVGERGGFVRQQTAAMNRADSLDLLPALRMPALVLCGEDDQVTPVALSREMASLLPLGADLVVVPTCGHMATLEQPAAVGEALTRWLAAVDASR